MMLVAWRRQCPPYFIGGAEVTEMKIAAHSVESGVPVTWVGCSQPPWEKQVRSFGSVTRELESRNIHWDRTPCGITYEWRGIQCIIATQATFLQVVAKHIQASSVVWTSQEGCDQVSQIADGRPVASYAHSVSSVGLMSGKLGARWVFAPSHFVVSALQPESRPILFRPPIDWPKNTVGRKTRAGVLFFNPIPAKGLETALALARSLPNVPFTFVEGWWDVSRTAEAFPPNVTYLSRIQDPKSLFRSHLLTVVPSVIPDASPRVILEAVSQGCAVLGSGNGGIPEYLNCTEVCYSTDEWIQRTSSLIKNKENWSRVVRSQWRKNASLLERPFETLHSSGVLEAAA